MSGRMLSTYETGRSRLETRKERGRRGIVEIKVVMAEDNVPHPVVLCLFYICSDVTSGCSFRRCPLLKPPTPKLHAFC